MTLGDRVAVMKKGLLQQVAAPQELYDRPTNLFVAGFIGSPAMNLVEAELVRSDGRLAVAFGEHRLRIDDEVVAERPALERFEGRKVALGIRPEDLEDASLADEAPGDRRLSAQVDIREDMGSEVFVHFGVGAPPVRTKDVEEAVAAGAPRVLLDNMSPEEIAEVARRFDERVVLEASGGITLDNVRRVAQSGVQLISVGALTHSAPALDVSLSLEPL